MLSLEDCKAKGKVMERWSSKHGGNSWNGGTVKVKEKQEKENEEEGGKGN